MRQPTYAARSDSPRTPGSQPPDVVMRSPHSATTAGVARTRRPCLGLTHLNVHVQMTPTSAATLGCSQGEHYPCQLRARW